MIFNTSTSPTLIYVDIIFSLRSFLAILKLFKNDDGFNITVFIPYYFVLLNPCPSNLLITISSKSMSYIQGYLEEKVFKSVGSIPI